MFEPSKINSDGYMELGVKDQLVKVVLATVAGFIASKLVEVGYDRTVYNRLQNSTQEITVL